MLFKVIEDWINFLTVKQEQHVSTICYNCHNDYVWKLSGFNKTNETLYETIIPELLTVSLPKLIFLETRWDLTTVRVFQSWKQDCVIDGLCLVLGIYYVYWLYFSCLLRRMLRKHWMTLEIPTPLLCSNSHKHIKKRYGKMFKTLSWLSHSAGHSNILSFVLAEQTSRKTTLHWTNICLSKCWLWYLPVCAVTWCWQSENSCQVAWEPRWNDNHCEFHSLI